MNYSLEDIKSALDKVNFIKPKASKFQPSAVLVPIVKRSDGLYLLLTQRANHLRHHPGQISFPGGRMDDTDKNLILTALRETYEEVGIPENKIQVIGKLELLPTVSKFMIQPIVGIVDSDYQMVINTDEVDEAFEVPLNFLLNKVNWQKSYREFNGINFPVYAMPYQSRNIWGATAQIIVNLAKALN